MKLQTNKEQLSTTRKQCENAEENIKILEKRANELIAELDAARSQCSQLNQEKDVLQKGLDTVRVEKSALEKSRIEINGMVRIFYWSHTMLTFDINVYFYVKRFHCRWKT